MKRICIYLLYLLLVSLQNVVAQTVTIHVNNYTTRDGMASNVVNCGVQDRQGYIWLGTNHGLTRFDGHQFVNFYVEDNGEQQIEGITHIVEDTTRNVLLMSGKDYRLLCFDLVRMRFVNAEGMSFPKTDNDADEAAFIARAKVLGIQRGNITNRRHDLHYVRLADGREIFTTIDNGFYIYDPTADKLHHFCSADDNPVIESDYINDAFLDHSGSIWLATTFAGIYQLNLDEGLLRYHALDGSSGNIRSFSQLSDRAIAVGDMEGNIFYYDTQTGKSRLIFQKGYRAYAMRTDSHGRFWVGTRGGGVWVDDRHLNATDGFSARQVFDICFAEDGTAWIGTFDGGLIEAKEQSDGTFSYNTYLPDEKIHQILIDRKGCLWVATENGIFRKDGAEFHPIYNKGKVVCITQGPADTIYAGSNGYGLLIITKTHVKHFTTSDGLANNCVEAIAIDGEGNTIATTDQGISIISRHDGTVRNVYSSLGLMADTYNEDAILRTTDGRIFLGSQRGLVELGKTTATSNNTGYFAPCISSIYVNDAPHYDRTFKVLHLPHNQNNLRFNFSSFAYKDLASVIYSYRLEGIDDDWRPSTKESFALYTNLRPGQYRFHVRYRFPGGSWSEETICDITIAQPWYWTWWARLFYLLIIVLFIWYEWHQYQQRLSLQRQLNQRLTALYAVEAQQEHAIKEDSASGDVMTEKNEPEENKPKENKPKETAQQKAANQRNKDFLDRLDHLILQNLMQTDLDVNFIAQEMCVSYSTLHRRIKSLTGITANEYVRKHRLTKAMQLLRDGHNASEVAMQCGFNSPSYFTRCFKAEYGILPSEV